MARSIAVPPPLEGAPRAQTAAGRHAAATRPARSPARVRRPGSGLGGSIANALAALLRAILVRRPLRLAIVLAILAGLLGGLGWLWFRGSSFAAVTKVRIVGVRGPDSGAIDAALAGAARRMSTLDASPAALRSAVAAFPVVRGVSMTTSFPHAMTIVVAEQVPVAVLSADGSRTALAADGVALGSSLVSGSLPVLTGPPLLPIAGARAAGAALRSDLVVLGAAPRVLDRLITRVYEGPEGLTLRMHDGLLVYFGDDSRPRAKWLALARVLADPSSRGSLYIDVRLPERPAAGTELASARPLHQSAPSEESSLAASLDRAIAGETEAMPTSTTPAATGIPTAPAEEPAAAATGEPTAPAEEPAAAATGEPTAPAEEPAAAATGTPPAATTEPPGG